MYVGNNPLIRILGVFIGVDLNWLEGFENSSPAFTFAVTAAQTRRGCVHKGRQKIGKHEVFKMESWENLNNEVELSNPSNQFKSTPIQ